MFRRRIMSYTLTPYHKAVLERESNKACKDQRALNILAKKEFAGEESYWADFTASQRCDLHKLINEGLVMVKRSKRQNDREGFFVVKLTKEGLEKVFEDAI